MLTRVRFIQVFPSKPSSVLPFRCLFSFFHSSSLCFLHFGETESVLEVEDTPQSLPTVEGESAVMEVTAGGVMCWNVALLV